MIKNNKQTKRNCKQIYITIDNVVKIWLTIQNYSQVILGKSKANKDFNGLILEPDLQGKVVPS